MIDLITIINALVSIYLYLFLFSRINGRKLSLKEIGLGYLLRFLYAVMATTLINNMGMAIVPYWESLVFPLAFSYICFPKLPKSLILFYGLFPPLLQTLITSSLVDFIPPLFEMWDELMSNSTQALLATAVSVYLTILLVRWLGYDFSNLRNKLMNHQDRKLIAIVNWAMVLFIFVTGLLQFFEIEQGMATLEWRKMIIVAYLIFFMGFIHRLDRYLREQVQESLNFQKEMQLSNMEKYSQHVEGLYKEVRGFRHDYTNLLTTLRLGIENEDMGQVKEIYDSVLKDSNKKFRNAKYDVGRLVNIQDSALKSLLASKFIQATESNISVTLEVPEKIAVQGIELVDFITIVSILCDNAIEAAMETDTSHIRMAYMALYDKQLFVIENSIKEQSIDTVHHYDFGVSSKGDSRGIGLYNILQILNHYPNVSLNTNSQDYTFGQVLEIKL